MPAKLLCDHELQEVLPQIIDPYIPGQVRDGVISYGLTAFGYDIRIGPSYKIFTPSVVGDIVIDPKAFDQATLVEHYGPHCDIPSNSYILAYSLEHFAMPADMFALVTNKSTYARCGILANITPLEPGWHGHLTIEIANLTSRRTRVYANEGIAQVVFFRNDQPVLMSYARRAGKYQHQPAAITTARI